MDDWNLFKVNIFVIEVWALLVFKEIELVENFRMKMSPNQF